MNFYFADIWLKNPPSIRKVGSIENIRLWLKLMFEAEMEILSYSTFVFSASAFA